MEVAVLNGSVHTTQTTQNKGLAHKLACSHPVLIEQMEPAVVNGSVHTERTAKELCANLLACVQCELGLSGNFVQFGP